MFRRLRRWREQRRIETSPLTAGRWRDILAGRQAFAHLAAEERETLRHLAIHFLHARRFLGAHGLAVPESACWTIAAQACLPVLHLGLEWLDDWQTVIVYPDEFVPDHEYMDEHGILHHDRHPLAGEAWDRGPLLLSLADALHPDPDTGYNVTIHEIAHKLDMRNGADNGQPPLHADMDPAAWQRAFADAYEDLCRRTDHALPGELDPYGAESPAEFLAVCSEAFFENPALLERQYPAVAAQLRLFHRQDTRRGRAGF